MRWIRLLFDVCVLLLLLLLLLLCRRLLLLLCRLLLAMVEMGSLLLCQNDGRGICFHR